MIFSTVRLVAYGAIATAVVGACTWIYFEGKEEAREECKEQIEAVEAMWEGAMGMASERNKLLAADLAIHLTKKAEVEAARIQEIIKYVEKDPSSDTIIFDADGLRLLNAAQKGAVTDGK